MGVESDTGSLARTNEKAPADLRLQASSKEQAVPLRCSGSSLVRVRMSQNGGHEEPSAIFGRLTGVTPSAATRGRVLCSFGGNPISFAVWRPLLSGPPAIGCRHHERHSIEPRDPR